MIIVKLIVLFCYINGFSATPTNYCEICLNHTLCKYKALGPGPSCVSYNSSAKLTSQDINELVNRINERRNFVAMGHSKILLHAANMKKIRWSTELATFAQRWVDQCDPTIHPDKEDLCRDLEYLKVGQNIASVIGPSPGLNVKGFVEMWFIQVLDYAGSVTYYNKSKDYMTSYLTQLIWANTEFVGCGKAKFYIDERKIMLERLVCNFAPKGNTHGKPVYSIGYPATQCEHEMVPDDLYKGLCAYEDDALYTKLNTHERPANNLLRNLSNNSKKHKIDPIRNSLIQRNKQNNSSNEQRNQKTRHIITNKTYGTVKRIPRLRNQMFGNSFTKMTNNYEYHYQHDRGHSRLYHEHESPPPQHYYETTKIIYQGFGDDYGTEPTNSYYNTNFRRFNQFGQCTRRTKPVPDNCELNQCSTTAPDCCPQITMCPPTCSETTCSQPVEDHTCFSPNVSPRSDPCAVTQHTCPPINYHTTCLCTSCCFTTTLCPKQFVSAGTYQFNDIIRNISVRSGNHRIPQENSSHKSMSFLINPDNNRSYKTIYDENYFDQIHKGVTIDSKYKSQEHDYIYRSFNSGMRKKRQLENEMPAKPFWQIENFNQQIPPLLKSMRFTTLSRINRNRKNTDSAKWMSTTEPITLRSVDYADYQPEQFTEKYLSFDELMHLRKISDGFAHYDIRRQGVKTKKTTKIINTTKKATIVTTLPKKKPNIVVTTLPTKKTTIVITTLSTIKTKTSSKTSTKLTTTKVLTTRTDNTQTTKRSTTVQLSEYTTNTPFERKKYCTRLLTCTWTPFMGLNDKDENGEGSGAPRGTQTPPGYVDGCTRTSTCTRDYMERNVQFSTSTDSGHSREFSSLEDEDYCERRSLEVQRRNSDSKKRNVYQFRNVEDYTNKPILPVPVESDSTFNSLYTESVTESVSNTHDCICNEKYCRRKREATECLKNDYNKCDNPRSIFSYNNLYFLILNKILRFKEANRYHDKHCSCNSSISLRPAIFLFILTILNTYCS